MPEKNSGLTVQDPSTYAKKMAAKESFQIEKPKPEPEKPMGALDELLTWANRGLKFNRKSKNYKLALTDLITKINEMKNRNDGA